MKIEFTKLSWRNLISTGNVPIEVDLNAKPTSLIVGDNGAGKSTILDALCFGLFGKPFRKANKPSIVNSINQKGLLVEIEFKIGPREYKIVRGMAPVVFEVYQDGNMLNQDAAAKDYQKYIEQNILKINFRSFTQIVILGTASFVPFMQLPASHRREVIEDLLDIRIFSYMNLILKAQIVGNKEEIRDIETQIDLVNEKVRMQKDHLGALEDDQNQRIETAKTELEQAQDDIKKFQDAIESYNAQRESTSNKISNESKIRERLTKLSDIESQLQSKLRTYQNNLNFFKNENHCPTCEQDILEEYKDTNISKYTNQIDEIISGVDSLSDDKTKLATLVKNIDKCHKIINSLDREIGKANIEITHRQMDVVKLNEQMSGHTNSTIDLKEENNKLTSFLDELNTVREFKGNLIEKREVYEICAMLLKDTGIKTQIIRQYIPIINQLINKYLSALDFFVNLELDENFNETIKSRHRDEFRYVNFSEGEKLRIDLSLMFAWRAVAKLKNSVNTNLLILDEVFDASLDVDGCDNFLKILNTLDEGTNVFVISHNQTISDNFDRVLTFEKKKNFSRLVEGDG